MILPILTRVPDDHRVGAIASMLDLLWVYGALSPLYPALGRPSIDPVLMFRMLILGYAFGLRSERLRAGCKHGVTRAVSPGAAGYCVGTTKIWPG